MKTLFGEFSDLQSICSFLLGKYSPKITDFKLSDNRLAKITEHLIIGVLELV